MELFIRYSSSIKKKRSRNNFHLTVENDSDIDVDIKLCNFSEKAKKAFHKKMLTKRLVILNIDWKVIDSTDIYSFLSPFVPGTGSICSVSVMSFYRSFNNLDLRLSVSKDELLKTDKIRSNKTFGLISCNSIKTAREIFKKCNGIELNYINILIDLRFAPNFQYQGLKILNHTEKVPYNYFPKFIIKTETRQIGTNIFSNHISEKLLEFTTNNSYLKERKPTKTTSLQNFESKILKAKKFEEFFKNLDKIDNLSVANNFFSISDFCFVNEFYIKFKNIDLNF
nr:ESF1 [Cryptomonas sp.]